MVLTNEDIDIKMKEVEEFESQIPGIRYGSDYPEFALAVIGSSAFQNAVKSTTLLGLLQVIALPDSSSSEEVFKKGTDRMFEKSPLREVLLQMLYVGYKLGQGR